MVDVNNNTKELYVRKILEGWSKEDLIFLILEDFSPEQIDDYYLEFKLSDFEEELDVEVDTLPELEQIKLFDKWMEQQHECH
jgi:hypothetical protein